jgi:hypothetical protein
MINSLQARIWQVTPVPLERGDAGLDWFYSEGADVVNLAFRFRIESPLRTICKEFQQVTTVFVTQGGESPIIEDGSIGFGQGFHQSDDYFWTGRYCFGVAASAFSHVCPAAEIPSVALVGLRYHKEMHRVRLFVMAHSEIDRHIEKSAGVAIVA